jgi:hypothetical protein
LQFSCARLTRITYESGDNVYSGLKRKKVVDTGAVKQTTDYIEHKEEKKNKILIPFTGVDF